jgi:hypothetical protein
MTQASSRFNLRSIVLCAAACTALLFAFATASAYAANGSAEDQYVGTVPTSTGDESPSDSLTPNESKTPIASDDGVVTSDSVKSAAEKAKQDTTAGGNTAGADSPSSVPPGTVPSGTASAPDSSGGFTLTNFDTPAGALTAAMLLVAAGGGLLTLSRRRTVVKSPSKTTSA